MKKAFVLGVSLLVFAACNNNQTPVVGSVQDVRNIETIYDIAYVNMDSLVTNYTRYIDLGAEFEAKATKIQGDLESKARKLQNEIMDFQEKAQKGLITRAQAAQLQEQLEKKSNDFEMQRQQQVGVLTEEEQVMTNQVLHAVTLYIAKFNADYTYKMILSTSANGPVLHADPGLNITKAVLDGLNAEYATERSSNKK